MITSERRKNYQFRQGKKVIVAATNDIICSLKLLLKLKHVDVNAASSSPILCDFNGRLVAKIPQKQLLQHYLSSMLNMFVISLVGLEKNLGPQPKISNHNMVSNQVEVAALRQL